MDEIFRNMFTRVVILRQISQCKGYVRIFKSSERSEHLKALTATISESLRTFSGLGWALLCGLSVYSCLLLLIDFTRQVQRWLCDTGSLSRHRASCPGHSNGPRDEHRIQTMFRIFTLFFLSNFGWEKRVFIFISDFGTFGVYIWNNRQPC